MSNKQLDWSNLGFGYVQTDKRYVANFKNGAWEEGFLTEDASAVLWRTADRVGAFLLVL